MTKRNQLFKESEKSSEIFRFFRWKYGEKPGVLGLVKVCSGISCYLERPLLAVHHVAPSRQFKTHTSNDAAHCLGVPPILKIGSDFTIHSMVKRYGKKRKAQQVVDFDKRCLVVNDATVLFGSKSDRGGARLLGAFAELLSDGKYEYADNFGSFILKGKVTCILNQTVGSYNRNRVTFKDSTFNERFLTVFHNLTIDEQRLWGKIAYKKRSKQLPRLNLDEISKNVKISRKWERRIDDITDDFHVLAMKSYNGTRDSINALFRSHASLNGRNYICEDEINLANLLRPHINDVFVPHKSKVLVYLKQGLTQTEIVRRLGLGKSMQSRISQWKKGFEEDGLLDRSK